MYQVKLEEEATRDMKNAYSWYEEQRLGLGEELMNEADKCLKELRQHP